MAWAIGADGNRSICWCYKKAPVRAKGCWTDHAIPDVWSEKTTKVHPHSKPIDLQQRLIKATTKEGDYVLDPAVGGYSVLEACRRAGREFIGGDIAFGEEYGEAWKG